MGADDTDTAPASEPPTFLFKPFWKGVPKSDADVANGTNTVTGTGCRDCMEHHHFYWWCSIGRKRKSNGSEGIAYDKARILEWCDAKSNNSLDGLVKDDHPPHPVAFFERLLLESPCNCHHHLTRSARDNKTLEDTATFSDELFDFVVFAVDNKVLGFE